MHRGRFIFTAALALVTVNVWAAEPQVLVDLDFSRDADLNKITINDPNSIPVEVVEENGKKRLRLTTTTGQVAGFFITTPVPATADYLATIQFEVMNDGGSPADGFAFIAHTGGPDKLGGAGGALGWTGGDGAFAKNAYAVEFNSYDGQGGQTVAWNMNGGRQKFDQSPFEHVDGGIYTAEIRVQPGDITVTVSGGAENMAPKQVMTTNFLKSLGCTNGTLFQNLTPEPIFFGITAATGGLGQITDILSLRVVSPAPAPATAGG